MRFQHALAISLAVHALVLFGAWPSRRETAQEPVVPPLLVTRLVELPKAEPQPAPRPAKPAKPGREAMRPEPQPLPLPAPSIAEPPAAPAPAVAEPSVATVLPQVDSGAANAATAAQYRAQLIAYAQRNKPPYPALARENNWTGDVTLDIALRTDGHAELGLRRGSGHEVLDKLALDTYQQALRAVPVPPALQGRPVRLEPLRVIYNLTE